MSVEIEMACCSEQPAVLACRGCLATDTILHNLSDKGLIRYFSEFTGFTMSPSDGFPQHMCSVCLVLLRKSVRFRYRCVSAQWLLQQMRSQHPVLTTEVIKSADRSNLIYNELTLNESINIDLKDDNNNYENILKELVKNIRQIIKNPKNESSDDEITNERKSLKNNKIKKERIINKRISELTDSSDEKTEITNQKKKLINKNKKEVNTEIIDEDSDRSFNTSDDEVLRIDNTEQKVKEEEAFIDTEIAEEINTDFDNPHEDFEQPKADEDSDRSFSTSDDEVLRIDNTEQKVKEEEDFIDTEIAEEINTDFDNPHEDFEQPIAITEVKTERVENEIEKPKKTGKKRQKNNPKLTKRIRKNKERASENDMEINEEWRKIIREIKEEIANNKNIKRRVPTKREILMLTKKAEEFSCRYNTEVRFLSKAEQQWEIELKRSSEEFQKAAFKCLECGKMFTSQETYNTHWSAHDPENGDYICEICRYRFKTRHLYSKHYFSLHSKKITCLKCGQVKKSWLPAKEHYIWHQEGAQENEISCEQCGLKFAIRKSYLMHVLNTHGGRAGGPRCWLCDRPFFNQVGLMLHFTRMHATNPRCSSCNLVFANTDVLAVHVNALGGCQAGHSSCPKCGRNFPTEGSMTSHYKQEHRKDHHKCEQCNKSFNNYSKYSKHMKFCRYLITHSGNETSNVIRKRRPKGHRFESRYCCEICGKETTSLASLIEHQRKHTDKKTFQCTQCPKSYKWKQNLVIHITTHTGERKYKCPICPKAFRQMQHRGAHMLTHTKERPFPCSLCPKRYTGLSALKDHVNTAHHGLPPRRWGKKKDQDGLQSHSQN